MMRCRLVVVLVGLALLVSSCESASLNGSYYYINSKGEKTSCSLSATEICSGAPGKYYRVNTDGSVHECTTQIGCNPYSTPISPDSCVVTAVYDTLVNKGLSWKVVSRQQDQNNSSSSAQVTFTSSTATTVTVVVDAHVNVDITAYVPAVVASVKADINASATNSMTTVVGNNYSFTVPPRATGFGNYGVRMQITSGHLHGSTHCSGGQSDLGTVTTYVPVGIGWCTWISGEPPCPAI